MNFQSFLFATGYVALGIVVGMVIYKQIDNLMK